MWSHITHSFRVVSFGAYVSANQLTKQVVPSTDSLPGLQPHGRPQWKLTRGLWSFTWYYSSLVESHSRRISGKAGTAGSPHAGSIGACCQKVFSAVELSMTRWTDTDLTSPEIKQCLRFHVFYKICISFATTQSATGLICASVLWFQSFGRFRVFLLFHSKSF